MKVFISIFISFIFLFGSLGHSQSFRLKDIVSYKGIRSNSLVGFGVVVGLNGTGDSKGSILTSKAMREFLRKLGFDVSSEEVLTQSVASVVVTAELPPFAKIGDKVSVRLSVVGDASSLEGGTLIMTPLKAGDSKIYAVAQGPILSAAANGKGKQSFTSLSVSGAATVEREFIPYFAKNNKLDIYLKRADLTTNSRLVKAINTEFKEFIAKSVDPSHIKIQIPESFIGRKYSFLERLEQVRVIVDDVAKVVINEKTGTIIMGSNVLLEQVYINHGSLSIKIKPDESKNLLKIGGTTIGELVNSLNVIGVTSKELISILQALKEQGALKAELKII